MLWVAVLQGLICNFQRSLIGDDISKFVNRVIQEKVRPRQSASIIEADKPTNTPYYTPIHLEDFFCCCILQKCCRKKAEVLFSIKIMIWTQKILMFFLSFFWLAGCCQGGKGFFNMIIYSVGHSPHTWWQRPKYNKRKHFPNHCFLTTDKKKKRKEIPHSWDYSTSWGVQIEAPKSNNPKSQGKWRRRKKLPMFFFYH